ncbi:hypothetical protein EYF80_001568 [Liparis tanakae]|uniref:Uncharacterized protein n=1 Tax=Liparis tanakae TaxID=230148 RepID=A0A4Z2JGE3_9TELE|nr:hypothetical protein EYF80_001568 [Liparis tanakae]
MHPSPEPLLGGVAVRSRGESFFFYAGLQAKPHALRLFGGAASGEPFVSREFTFVEMASARIGFLSPKETPPPLRSPLGVLKRPGRRNQNSHAVVIGE